MTETGQDFTVYRGEDKTLELTIAGSGSIATWTFAASFRRKSSELDAVDPIITKESGDGITIAHPDNRVVHIVLEDTDTSLFDDGVAERKYPWDLKRTNVDSESILAAGVVTVFNPASR